jgi:UDP-N-acetyl-D-galactosamine dehydrogenase
MNKKINIAIIGQGYVGLPLAIEFGKKYKTFGYDINFERINDLKKFYDHTKEASSDQIKNSKNLVFTSNLDDIAKSNIYIVTVPTYQSL